MAIQQRVYQPTASLYAAAASHLDLRAEWAYYRICGDRYVAITSGTSGKRYTVRADAAGCECTHYAKCGGICSHRLAVMLDAMEEELLETAAMEPRCPEGPEDAPVPTLRSFQDLYPGCAAGCGDLVEKRGESCWLCTEKRTRRLDAESRAAVFATIAPFTLNEQEV